MSTRVLCPPVLEIFGCSLFPTERLLEGMVTDFLEKDWGIITYPLAMVVQGTSFRGPGFSFSWQIPGLKTASNLEVGKRLGLFPETGTLVFLIIPP